MTAPASTPTYAPRSTAATALAAVLGIAGVAHFVAPKPFDQQVPRALPGDARTYTYVSGVAEIALAAGLLAPRTQRLAGGAAALFFVAVFPANIQMAINVLRSSTAPTALKVGVLARLPLQIPLITSALAVRRAAR